MKKKIMAAVIGLSMVFTTCFATVELDKNSIKTELKTITATGTTESEKVIAYSVTLKGDDRNDYTKVYSVGDAIANTDGIFKIEFEFPERAVTEMYTLYVGDNEGNIDFVDIKYVNTAAAEIAVKSAVSAAELEGVFAENSIHKEALMFLGFDVVLLNSLDNADKVCSSLFENCSLSEVETKEILTVFNTYLGLECINEDVPGGVEKLNLAFGTPAVKFNDLTDTKLKTYLTNGIYLKDTYTDPDAVNTAYRELNILYLINNAETGEISDLIELYQADLRLVGKDYYNTYLGMNNINQNRTLAKYLELLEATSVNSIEAFLDLFDDAVDKTSVDSGNNGNGGNAGNGGGGGGGGSSAPSGTSSPYVPYNPSPGILSNQNVQNKFSDIADYGWAKEAINALADKGIINGVTVGKFEPESNVTREQVVKMILLSIDKNSVDTECPFADVDKNEWYAPYVAEGYRQGIITGISETAFGTGESLTRQDLATIAVRAAKNEGIIDVQDIKKANFDDRRGIADYAVEAVDILYSMGVINGKGGNLFAPTDYCSRAEAAKIIYNIFFR